MTQKSRRPDREEKSDINISPMIDMVFILLIFFVVTAVFVEERGLDADTPQHTTSKSEIPPVIFRIAEDGKIQVLANGRETETPLGAVRTIVADYLVEGIVSFVVEAAPDIPAGRMINVVDEARRGGAEKITLKTDTAH